MRREDGGRRPLRVLFLCVGNSCRSQMAEGWARALGKGRIDAHSAGLLAAGVHPLAEMVMREAGVDISAQRSKPVEDYKEEEFDLVVTLCGDGDACPVHLGAAEQIHRPFYDPVAVDGSEEDRIAAFRKTREEIRGFVEEILEKYVG